MMMNTRYELGFERKIGYSFVGLLAGNAASFTELLLIASLQTFSAFSFLERYWYLPGREGLALTVVFAIYSVMSWAVVGIPAVLFLHARHIVRLPWFLSFAIGALLGEISLLAICLLLDRGTVEAADLIMFMRGFGPSAAIISGTAFIVYSVLVKRALSKEQNRSGAPKGTPRFFSVFDL